MAEPIKERACSDRRKFNYSAYLPERRSGRERRSARNKMNERKVA